MTHIQWYTLQRKTLEKANLIIQCILKDPFLKQTQISKLTGIPRPTVTRIINKLVHVGALRKIVVNIAGNNAYKYEVHPKFIDFLSKALSTNGDVHSGKPRGFSPPPSGIGEDEASDTEHSKDSSSDRKSSKNSKENSKQSNATIVKPLSRPDNPEELEKWCKDGFFRIHGFQRKWVLRNYRLIDDEEKWKTLALLLNDSRDTSESLVRKVRIGRKGKGIAYIVNVWNSKFRVHFSLQFRTNSLIVTLPKEESIYVEWDKFNENIKKELEIEIKEMAERAVKVYGEIFNQQVLAYDDGWVGRKKQLVPEVAYIDPDGIIRKVYEVEGATYIEGLGYWVDGSLSPTKPELEFDSIETASKFKKAIDALASGEIDEKIESLSSRISELEGHLEDKIARAVQLGVEKATEQIMTTVFAGSRPIQDQIAEMWKKIAEMQETLNLMFMYQIAKESGDTDLAEVIKAKLRDRVGLI